MPEKPLLSVIVPVYNSEKYLQAYLESLFAAKPDSFEVLLIDDGSRDKSAEICRRWAEDNSAVRYYRRENAGPSAARNFGIKKALGEFICFHDSDDLLDPEVFKKACSYLRECDADIFATDFHRVSDNGAVLDRVYQIQPSDKPLTGEAHRLAFVSSGDCVWNVWRYIFKREFIVQNSLLFLEGYNCGEDLEFIIRALIATENIAFYHPPYYFYRVNYGGSLTRQYTPTRVSQLMTMMRTAHATLENTDCALRTSLLAMLGREYLLNLSLLKEVAAPQREETREYLRTAWLLLDGTQGVYKLAAAVANLLGIDLTAALLLALKKIKRRVRSAKGRTHEYA